MDAQSISQPLRIAVIVGSRREGRLAPQITTWFTGQLAEREDLEVDIVDLLDVELPDGLAPDDARTAALRPRLLAADAFVVIVPEYNRSIPGPLKTLIDTYNAEWEAKPFAFVAYGLSASGGLRAVEHLRQILAEFHAVGIKDTVAFPRIMDLFAADGTFAPALDGCNAAAKLMLDDLAWWGQALREAKRRRPYRL